MCDGHYARIFANLKDFQGLSGGEVKFQKFPGVKQNSRSFSGLFEFQKDVETLR